MSINLKQELIELLESEGLGRWGLLRKAEGTAPMSYGGEWNPEDPRFWDGRSYIDYEVMYYYTPTMMSQIKSVLGAENVYDEIMFIAAKSSYPVPTTNDALIPLKYDVSGNLVLKENEDGDDVYLIDESRGFMRFNSVLPYWSDTNSQTVFYALSTSKIRSGWGGNA